MQPPMFSVIVPSRHRPEQLRRFLGSVADMAAHPEAIEVVLVIDADDAATTRVTCDRLQLKRVVVPPGLPMGALNRHGYEASAGRYLMLANDDVTAHSRQWDRRVLACFRAVADDILLVHVNDRVFGPALCTFPIVSRTFCEIAGGICPPTYLRYRIDDHVEDHFNMLGALQERRTVYLPGVVFEHANFVVNPAGVRQYFSEASLLARDAAHFDAQFGGRKEATLRLMAHIHPTASAAQKGLWRARLDAIPDAASLRVPGRQWVWPALGCRPPGSPARLRVLLVEKLPRACSCARRDGYRALGRKALAKARIYCRRLLKGCA